MNKKEWDEYRRKCQEFDKDLTEEWDEYRRKCQEFDKELTGTINAVMITCTIIGVLALGFLIINKLF